MYNWFEFRYLSSLLVAIANLKKQSPPDYLPTSAGKLLDSCLFKET